MFFFFKLSPAKPHLTPSGVCCERHRGGEQKSHSLLKILMTNQTKTNTSGGLHHRRRRCRCNILISPVTAAFINTCSFLSEEMLKGHSVPQPTLNASLMSLLPHLDPNFSPSSAHLFRRLASWSSSVRLKGAPVCHYGCTTSSSSSSCSCQQLYGLSLAIGQGPPTPTASLQPQPDI